MFIKLAIITGIVILGGMIFTNEIGKMFPDTTAAVLESLKNDTTSIISSASNSAEHRFDESLNNLVGNATGSIIGGVGKIGETVGGMLDRP